jgi:methyl-accepting chemotaxis protein
MEKFFARFSVQQKLFGALTFGFLGLVIFTAVSFSVLNQNKTLMESLVNRRLPMLEASERLGQALGAMDSIGRMDAANAEALAAFQRVREAGGDIAELEETFAKYDQAYLGVNEILQNVVAGLEQVGAVQGKLQKHTADLAVLVSWANDLRERQGSEFRASVDSANKAIERAIYAGWILILCAIPFALSLYLVTRSVTGGLTTISVRLAEVSRNMLRISTETSTSSSKLATASAQQSTAVTESVASMDQMKVKLGQTVRHSADALKSSEESFREASDGKVVIKNLKEAMLDIERSYEQLEEVKQVVHMIGDKTNVINDIVFKTQLLSFNASIEAARAGQHGRGFAVVASEVGKLAEMSGKAAHEISRLLEQSSLKVAEIVESTKIRVDSANQMSQRCASVFERINERAGQVKFMVNSISSSAAEQESDIHMVGRAMNEMNESASETDSMAHAISELSMVLKGHSESLSSSVKQLDALVRGGGSGDDSSSSNNNTGISTKPALVGRRSA